MSESSSRLLLKLKDYSSCNDDLAVLIRKTVLEPFQVDVSRPDSIRKPPPTPTRFKQMATQLAPVAMRIVNQNIGSLAVLKRQKVPNYTVVVNCLVDTSFYALTALRHMSTLTTLKPLDIEKTTSNLICKMVELGEYNRALDELGKFRSLLASVAKVQLDSNTPSKINSKKAETAAAPSLSSMKGVLTESLNNYQPARSYLTPELVIKNQWEDDMLNKYSALLQFPLDKTINDRTMILLVLAYQMNTIRSWCEIQDGALAKYIPYFLSKPGNFFDWCQHLFAVDSETAKKQLDTLQRMLYRVANKYPLTEDAAYHSYSIQVVALRALTLSGSVSLKMVMDRMVRIGITYEKATKQTLYNHIQKSCNDFLENLEPNTADLSEMDSYFVLCEYYAYASRKAKSYKGAFYAYKYMIRPLRDIIETPSNCTYYYAAYAANAKLALGSVQMDKMVLDATYADISMTLNESISCLRIVSQSLSENQSQDEHSEQALYNLCKSIEGFRQSCKRLYEFVSDKTKEKLMESKNDAFKTPPRMEEIVAPTDFGQWNSVIEYMNGALQQCSETLPLNLCLAKKSSNSKRSTTQNDIMVSFIDIMVLLSRMQFDVSNEDTYPQAYEYLSAAEQMCAEKKYTTGYRWLSGSYYNLGTAMIKTDRYSHAIYPLRKSSSLLEKDTERINTVEGRLQLCKRYEILGICCQKNKHYEDAIKAYRLALKRVPTSEVERFASKADTTAVSTMMERETLIPKLMDRFLQASVVDPQQASIHFASEFVDLSTLDASQQCFVYECELKVWHSLSLKMKLSKYELFIVEKLLQIYTAETHPLRRARVLLSQVRIERRKTRNREQCTRAALTCAKEANALLKVQDYAQDSNLLNYRRHYLALSTSWIGICSRELKEEAPNTFSATLQQWGILLKKITPIYHSGSSSKLDIKQVYDEIDDLDQFYDHMRMLSDLFAILGEYTHQICALRILLKLNNGLRDVQADHVSDSIVLSSTIGKLYCDLGYTGRASIEFKNAKLAISNRPCNSYAELVYRINYSYYLACIYDFDTSKEVFDATKIVWDNMPSADQKNTLTTVKTYTARCMLLADAYTTLSLIKANTEDLESAIKSSTFALQLLNKCIKIVQKSQEEKKSDELEDPFVDAPPPEEDARRVVFSESQWIMAQKTTACLRTLAELHSRKGSPNEAKYFVKQQPLLAEKVGSPSMLRDACLCASDFYLRYGDLDKSQDELERVFQLTGQEGLAQVKTKVTMAKLASANEYYGIASDTYDEANALLSKLSDSVFVSSLEHLVDVNEDQKRSKVVFEDEVEKSEKYDCLPLQRMQNLNILYKANAIAKKGEVENALELLERLEESDASLANEVELNASISQMRLSMIRQDLVMRPESKLLYHNTLVLPAMKIQAGRGALVKKTNMDHDLRVIRDALTQTLERMVEAQHVGWGLERTLVLENLCKESGYTVFLKNQISNNSRMLVNNYAILCSYYLSMANSISTRREMQSCLKIKMNQSFAGHAPSDNTWPMSPQEEQSFYDRLSRMSRNPKWLEGHLSSLSDLYREEHELDDNEFQEKFVDILPSNWTVCSLTMDTANGDLYAVRLRSGESPFAIKLPLDRASRYFDAYDSIPYTDAVNEFNAIIQGSDETIHSSSKCNQKSEIEAWWNARKALDGRLKTLLDSIENQWLSGFKGLLSGRVMEYKEELVKFQKAVTEATYKMVNELSATKKRVELSLAFCRMAVRLGRQPDSRDLDDIAYFAISCYEAQDIQVNYSKVEFKKLVDQIRVLISQYHEKSIMAGVDPTRNIPNDHVILILDKHMQMFPLESIPIIRGQSVSRLPCLSLLRDRILYTQAYNSRETYDDFGMTSSDWTDLTVSKRSAFYVLNPGGDLKDTQREFEPLFKSIPEWDGIVQTMPMELECKEALQSRDIYMYFGHSAGQAFMRGTTIRQLPRCAVSLLMGCSSGMLETKGEFDPYGYALNFLLGGSPAVVANLWDVTDRSIDKLTKHMMHSWGMLKKTSDAPKSLVQAVAESRNQCKLSYLIGAAPVVYGIPVYIERAK